MKKKLRILTLTLVCAAALCVSALADSGPKPQLVVRVEHAPEEPYYLDILASGDYEDPTGSSETRSFSGLEWSYGDAERAALDEALLTALRAAVPEGWHACTAQGTNGAPMWGQLYAEESDGAGNPLHTFGYFGVPDTCRILMVTKSGAVFLSDPFTRSALQTSATVDWAEKTVAVPPVRAGYVLQFFSTFLPTLLIEGLLLWPFGYRFRKSWKPFLPVFSRNIPKSAPWATRLRPI